jgi:hypothetical protein
MYGLVDHQIWIPSIINCGERQNNFVNNPHFLQEVKDNIRIEIDCIWRRKLRSVSGNISKRCDPCLHPGSSHFETYVHVLNGPSWTAASEWDLIACYARRLPWLRSCLGTRLVVHCTREVTTFLQVISRVRSRSQWRYLDCSEDGGSWRLKNASTYVKIHPTSFARNRKSLLIRVYYYVC